MSSILSERNGHQSSTKRTKNTDIQYFYISDQVQQKTIHITYCPIEELIADFVTKPLQVPLFLKMCHLIMGMMMPMPALTSSRSVLGEPEPEQERN